jgi:hypothetical protein
MAICWTARRGNGSSYVVCIPGSKSKNKTKSKKVGKSTPSKSIKRLESKKVEKPTSPTSKFKKGTVRNGYIIKMVKVPTKSGYRKAWRKI